MKNEEDEDMSKGNAKIELFQAVHPVSISIFFHQDCLFGTFCLFYLCWCLPQKSEKTPASSCGTTTATKILF